MTEVNNFIKHYSEVATEIAPLPFTQTGHVDCALYGLANLFNNKELLTRWNTTNGSHTSPQELRLINRYKPKDRKILYSNSLFTLDYRVGTPGSVEQFVDNIINSLIVAKDTLIVLSLTVSSRRIPGGLHAVTIYLNNDWYKDDSILADPVSGYFLKMSLDNVYKYYNNKIKRVNSYIYYSNVYRQAEYQFWQIDPTIETFNHLKVLL